MKTLKDIATKLNVSTSTVSKALNDSPEIGSATKARIRKVADLYGYRPNKMALSLKKQNTKTIGVILPSILNRFFATTLLGIEKEASRLGFQIITSLSNETLAKEKESLNLFSNGSVDGIIMAVSQETQVLGEVEHLKRIQNMGIPVLLFDRDMESFDCDRVVIDDYKAIQQITKKLIDKGRNQIAFISTISKLNVGKLRCQGYKDAIQNYLNNKQDYSILNIEDNIDIQDQIKSFLVKQPSIDALIAADNRSGTIAVNVARELGISIPEQLSVIGFSDAIISELSTPKLGYVNQNAEEIGKTALSLMVNRLKGDVEPEQFVTKNIEVQLVAQNTL